MKDYTKSYIRHICGYLGTDQSQVFLYWKGRVALFAALKAAGIGSGDEVIVPGLTCVVVPNAILYCNAKPVYADVRTDTLTLDVDSVKSLINRKTKAVIIQNTFGLSADVDTLVAIARAKGILVLEDCTHGFGGYYNGLPNGTLADASFFSTQWNKPFSTGLGGILLVNRPGLFPGLESINCMAVAPGRAELTSLWLSMQTRRFVFADATYWWVLQLYRCLSRLGLVTGSSSATETDSTQMPDDYFKRHSTMQAKAGIEALQNFSSVLSVRRAAAIKYRQIVAKHDKWHVSAVHDSNNSHLKYPLLIRNRKALFEAAKRQKIRLSDWFCSPIHPVKKGFSAWLLDETKIPKAFAISQKLLTIDTDVENVQHVCDFLATYADLME